MAFPQFYRESLLQKYLYTIFPAAIQGRMKASEMYLKKEKGWFQPKEIGLSIFQ